jgi:hypothetical protein
MLTEGIVALDGSGGAKFADRNENEQVAALEALQTTPFFLKVRGAELESLYSNPAMWKAFGYQGPAYAASTTSNGYPIHLSRRAPSRCKLRCYDTHLLTTR